MDLCQGADQLKLRRDALASAAPPESTAARASRMAASSAFLLESSSFDSVGEAIPRTEPVKSGTSRIVSAPGLNAGLGH